MLFFALSQFQFAYAQETLDLGVLDYSDLQVVQNQLYTKKGKKADLHHTTKRCSLASKTAMKTPQKS